jgi:uncharacterized membrane protein YoaT (DUF817 family)
MKFKIRAVKVQTKNWPMLFLTGNLATVQFIDFYGHHQDFPVALAKLLLQSPRALIFSVF